jgi:hypothetical protein
MDSGRTELVLRKAAWCIGGPLLESQILKKPLRSKQPSLDKEAGATIEAELGYLFALSYIYLLSAAFPRQKHAAFEQHQSGSSFLNPGLNYRL